MGVVNRVFIIGWDGAGNFVKDSDTPHLDGDARFLGGKTTCRVV
ncbi:MAG: hypothetical protein K0S39_4008 [Paenibacillus sp.]|jgi:hypothetical protein|nr:hypothetical protein [Paenibacillus sp.]